MRTPLASTPTVFPRWPLSVAASLCFLALAASLSAQERDRNDNADPLAFTNLPADRSERDRRRAPDGESGRDAQVGLPYARVAPAVYADGIGALVAGPDLRYISNRIFADGAQNLFSPNGVTQWAYNWGQFLDHNIGLRESGDEVVQQPFDEFDPLESFSNSANALTMTRSAAVPGTGISTPREQINTITPLIDGWAVYGDRERQAWLREDGSRRNRSARLLLTDQGNLPTANARGDAGSAPFMEQVGRLRMDTSGSETVVAGDVRANEHIGLTAAHTLFAREHNRIVDALPADWSERRKFRAAHELVTATIQYITYAEFLPALGVDLPQTTGFDRTVDARVTNEFATVGFRAHSMIHGEIEMAVPVGHFTDDTLASLTQQGVEMEPSGDELELAVPLNVAFANPQLMATLGAGPIAAGLASEAQYANDEQIDNQLRSVLFQLPRDGIADPNDCLDGVTLPACFNLVGDLGALDVFRQRDHGIPDYNRLRVAYGLAPVNQFTDITGEATDAFDLTDPLLAAGDPINNPAILDFVELRDGAGNLLEPDSEAAEGEAVLGIRRSTLAARLRAIYGDVNAVDAFVGMVSEPLVPGTELGELEHAIWQDQFLRLRDGDPDFYLWNARLAELMQDLAGTGLTYEQRLYDVIVNNSNVEADALQTNVFLVNGG